jgi:hypothetical protein
MPEDLPVVMDDEHPLRSYVLEHAVRAAGYRPIRAKREDVVGRPHLLHTAAFPQHGRCAWVRRDDGPIDWARVRSAVASPPADLRFDVDLVRAVGALLTDEVNDDVPGAELDGHQRLPYAASWTARSAGSVAPFADACVNALGAAITAVLGRPGMPRWPEGRRAAIGLSHDVDEPDRYALLRDVTRPWRLRRAPRTLIRTAIGLAGQRLGDSDPDAYWAFDELTALEAGYGFCSTFLFAVTPYHRRGGTLEDVRYDVTGRRYRDAIARLLSAGFGIGLHASYRAHERAGQLEHERSVLAHLAGADIMGVRHHYWHLGADPAHTLRAHERAGFRYDSSLAFNDHPGFRRSAGLPYRPFDGSLGRPVRVLQLPPFCMDGNFFYTSLDVRSAVAAVNDHVQAIRAAGSFGAVDWHVQASIRRAAEWDAWGAAYITILGDLADNTDLWVTSLERVTDWVEMRERHLGGSA